MTAPDVQPLVTAKPWLFCDISRTQWHKLSASGKTPLPLRLGIRKPVWRISELHDWIRAGAPDRATWERLKAEAAGGGQ